jgi:SPP1 family predicted phage head-tail adaptor
MPAAGRLRHRVTLQARVAGADEWGAPSTAWQDVATVWASVEPVSGREFFAGAQTQSAVTSKVIVRAGVAVTPAMRAVFCGRTLQVEAVLTSSKGDMLTLMCAEVE